MENEFENNNRKFAYESWKYHQNIIDRKEKLIFTMRNWIFTIIIAITLAYSTDKVKIDPGSIFFISFLIIVLFYLMEIFFRTASELSQKSVEEIILFLCNRKESFPLSFQYTPEELQEVHKKLAFQGRVWFPYAILVTMVFFTVLNCN